jgi:RNA polymerase sigma-70 factor (ECF subfamily)
MELCEAAMLMTQRNNRPSELRLVSSRGRGPEEGLPAALAEDTDGAFERLVRTYQDRLFSFALRLSRSREDAEEIAQDAFVRAYRALKTYPPERIAALALRSWLYQITLNVTRNRFRRRRPVHVPLASPDGEGVPMSHEPEIDPAERPDAIYEKKSERRGIAALVAGLPDRYRMPLVLRYIEGLPVEEVATVLHQPIGTTKSHLHRGVNALREALSRSRRSTR